MHYILNLSGEDIPPQEYTLKKEQTVIGRSADADIVIEKPAVSRQHARLDWDGEKLWITDLSSQNGSFLNDVRIQEPQLLKEGDEIRLGRKVQIQIRSEGNTVDASAAQTLFGADPDEVGNVPATVVSASEQAILFGEKDEISVGRASDNDLVLNFPTVSRHHARVKRKNGRMQIRDLNTSNGTFVNNRRIRSAWLEEGDTVRIGMALFVVGGNGLTQETQEEGMWLAAVGLKQWVRPDLNILQDVSLVIEPHEMVVMVGQSGSGKTTLMNAFSGFHPASEGEVVVNGVNIYRNFDEIRQHIGFVPQQDIIHKELTIWEALNYAARLRMPPDMSKAERHARIEETLDDLDLLHRKDVPIAQLSGGQQKRASIGVELLTQPGLFFLDEPTSGLDPSTETNFMKMLRRLANKGRTIIVVTHTTKNVLLADKVIFMARGGYLAFFGAPKEALTYFDSYRNAEERAQTPISFDEIYNLLNNQAHGSAEEWGKRFRQHKIYRQYVEKPLQMKGQLPYLDDTARNSLMMTSTQESALPDISRPKTSLPKTHVSGWHQFRVLFERNLRVLARDRFSLTLMLLVAPIVSALDFLLAALLGKTPFDFYEGSFPVVMTTLFSLTIYAVMVGSLSSMREIIKERDIYRRERLVNLKMLPYAFSKLGIAVVLAFYQAVWYVALHYLAFEMPGGWHDIPYIYLTLALTALAGMMLGLLSSAIAPNANAAPLIVILFMVPQIVLSGAQVPLPDAVSALSSTRWGLEALMSITGVGSDLMADPCWELPYTTRSLMTVEDETGLCRCMGLNLMDPNSCQFPGIGQYATPLLAAPPPIEPMPPSDPPAEPVLPDSPTVPEVSEGAVAVALYLQDMKAYQEEVLAIQDAYKAKLTEYQSRTNVYKAQVFVYQQALMQWQISRSLALEPAKGMVAHFLDDYGWTFVNLENHELFWRKITRTWLGQGTIILTVFVLILGILRWRD